MDRASLHPSCSFWVQLLKQHSPHPPKPCLAQPSPKDSLLRLEWGLGVASAAAPFARTRGLGPLPSSGSGGPRPP